MGLTWILSLELGIYDLWRASRVEFVSSMPILSRMLTANHGKQIDFRRFDRPSGRQVTI